MAVGDNVQAEAYFRKAIKADPLLAEAYTNLAILIEPRSPKKAEQFYRTSLSILPECAETLANLADLLAKQKRFNEAESLYVRSIELNPASSISHSNMGVLLMCLKREDEAEVYLRRSLALKPENTRAAFNLSYLMLLQGRYEEGWDYLDARNFNTDANLPFPKWKGESLQGKSLLVWYELGFGDEIQFCRYIPKLRELGVADLTLVCRPELKSLFLTLQGVDTLYSATEHIPHRHYDYWTMPLSLPRFFKTRLDSIPNKFPYLRPSQEKLEYWRGSIPEDARKKVGLVWQGNPRHENDDQRSLSEFKLFKPLWEIEGVQFISLQKGFAAEPGKLPKTLTQLGKDFQDFSDTAAVIDQLDLLISVDTAVVHLAGALGHPCWVMVPYFKTDWRWLKDREDSPWYPEVMRVFRQGADQLWEPVISVIRDELQRWVDDNP